MMIELAKRDSHGPTSVGPTRRLTAVITESIRSAFHEGLSRLRKAPCERQMRLLERLELGGKRQLLLVTCNGQRFLVGAGGDCINSMIEVRSETDPRRAETESDVTL